MLQIFVEQVLRPLVLWNFGDMPFEVSCKSLLKTQAGDKLGDDKVGDGSGRGDFNRSQAMKDYWARRKANEGTISSEQQGAGATATTALSLDPATSGRILSIVRRVLCRGAA